MVPQKYSRASALFFDAPMALLPSKMDEIRAFFEAKMAGANLDFEDRMEPMAARMISAVGTSPASGGGQIAVIPLYGVLSPRMNMMTAISGGTSTTMFAQMLRDQVNNPQVKAIIVDIDSPGGAVAGTPEAADVIHSLRGTKPIVGQVNALAASAAYWLASQMDEIVATPSAQVGHIGVATLLIDRSGELEQQGIKVRQVTAGRFKHEQATGSDLVPITDSKVQHAQQQVDEAYAMFVSAVARGRGTTPANVRNGYGEGRVVSAQEAVKVSLADRVATLEQTIQRFANGGRVARRTVAPGASRMAIETEQRERFYAYEHRN